MVTERMPTKPSLSQPDAHSQTLIIELLVASRQSVMLQSILQGEDGLGVIRCFDSNKSDPEKKKQQLWTSADQKADVYDC